MGFYRNVMMGGGIGALAAAAVLGGTGAASAQVVAPQIQAALNATTAAVISAVSRPTSPFVTGLATEVDANTCGIGPWTRANAGYLRAGSGGTTIDVRYGGILGAADLSCFNINGSGLDLSAGAEVGKLWGIGNDVAAPTASATLDQTFFGGYLTAAKGPISGAVEVRRELNTFTAQGLLPGFGIPDGTQLQVNRTIVNAAASYNIELQDGISLVPSAGISVISTDGGTTTVGASSLTLNPSVGAVGFVSGTLAKVIVLADQKSALQPFATASYYHDFGLGLTGSVTTGGVTTTGAVPGPGSYGELSLGINYVKLIEGGGPRQFSATLRGDAKFNGNFYGLSVTGQARVQF